MCRIKEFAHRDTTEPECVFQHPILTLQCQQEQMHFPDVWKYPEVPSTIKQKQWNKFSYTEMNDLDELSALLSL